MFADVWREKMDEFNQEWYRDEPAPEMKEDMMSIGDEDDLDKIEEFMDMNLSDMTEDDLIEVVRHFVGVDAQYARYDENFGMITYGYEAV